MKFLLVLSFIFNTQANSEDILRDMLLAEDMMAQYEKMFERMVEDMRNFERRNGKGLTLEERLLKSLGHTQLSHDFYEWKESEDYRELSFKGELVEDGKTDIEIKNGKIHLKGTFMIASNSGKTMRFVQINIPTPKDCDEEKVEFRKSKDSLILKFPKKYKNVRTPIKKKAEDLTI